MRNALTAVGIFIFLGAIAAFAWLLFPQKSAASLVRDEVRTCLEAGVSNWRGACFEELAKKLLSTMTLEETLSALADIDEEDGIKQQCHALVHNLGQLTYGATKSLPQTFVKCSSAIACGEGCYHGAVEGYIIETGKTLENKDVTNICSRDFTGNEVNYDACVHGLGHAFMLLEGDDIMRALPRCDFLGDDDDRAACYDGVFMENIFGAASLYHPSRYLKPDDPMYPCTIVEERYKNSCYSSQVNLVMPHNPERHAVGARYCADIPDQYSASCYSSLGGDAVLLFEKPEDVVRVCSLAPRGENRDSCLAMALLFRAHGTAGNAERLGEICFAAELEDRPRCFQSAGVVLADWYPNERARECALINARGTKEYGWCMGETI